MVVSASGTGEDNAGNSDMGSEQTDATASTAPSASTEAGPVSRSHQADRSEAAEGPPLAGIEGTRFRAIRNAAYHEDRERHYTRFHKGIMFVVVLFGTAVRNHHAKRRVGDGSNFHSNHCGRSGFGF